MTRSPADHLRFSNISFFDRRVGRVRFLTLHGHAFGLAPAVLNYNRQPELLVAVMRCLLETSCLHFYDDHLTLEPSTAQGSGQWAYRELCELLNVHLDEDKHSPMSSIFVFVGCLPDLSRLMAFGAFSIKPKPGRCEKLAATITDLLRRESCSPAEAATLRGKLGFLSPQLQGGFCDSPIPP